MARIRMQQNKITFKEGCELYLLDCRQRNLREGTIKHYRQSFQRFLRYFDEGMPIEKIDQDMYNTYVVQLCDELDNSVSINSYLRDLITVLHFWMDKGYLVRFKMRSIKVDQRSIDFFSFRKESLVTYKSASTSGFLLPLLLDGGMAALAASMRSTRDSRAEIAS